MNAKKHTIPLLLILSLALAFTACGGTKNPTTPVQEDVVVDAGGDLTALASKIGDAAMGVTEAGETIYYAEAKDSSFAILVFYDIEQGANVSFVGSVSVSNNAITIEDYNNGLAFTFTMEAAEGDTVVIDTGASGIAVMAQCDPIEVLKAMQSISDYSEALA